MKSKKGITLIILVITIILMGIVAGTVVTQSMDGLKKREISNLYNDIRNIQDKVQLYYTKYGAIPIKEEFKGTDSFKAEKNPNDNDKYYIIDLSALDNLSLSVKITNIGDDVYIINEETHTIYYPKGIEVNETTYYCLPEKYTLLEDYNTI